MTDTPNYLTAEQERVINDFQRVMNDLLVEGITTISASVGGGSDHCFVHGDGECFSSKYDRTGCNLASSINDGIRKFRSEVKSPAEQAQIKYDRAAKALEDAKAKLDALS